MLSFCSILARASSAMHATMPFIILSQVYGNMAFIDNQYIIWFIRLFLRIILWANQLEWILIFFSFLLNSKALIHIIRQITSINVSTFFLSTHFICFSDFELFFPSAIFTFGSCRTFSHPEVGRRSQQSSMKTFGFSIEFSLVWRKRT